MLDLWKSKGFLRVGEEDREEEIFPVTITPAIQHLVTPDLVQEIQIYLDKQDPEGDVFSSIEENRKLAKEAVRNQAIPLDPENLSLFEALTPGRALNDEGHHKENPNV